ncbi:hypothetical protein CsSME_00013742 [Camellia sinensis var. sinensis]
MAYICKESKVTDREREREREMKPLKFSDCEKEKGCVKWVEKYFKDCLCNLNDQLSFGIGLASLVSWGVAEIPQIITNFHNKSGHGLSLSFLCTWIVGYFSLFSFSFLIFNFLIFFCVASNA